MNQSPSPPKGSIRLSHGAWLEQETTQIYIPTGNQVLNFAASELEEFADILDDILTVLSSNSKINIHVCTSCGTEIESMEYVEPEGEDLQ